MQHQILINVIIFVAYVLNLPLNTLRSHSRSQRAGKWSLIMAHDRRPIYRAPTYIAVPMLGPHQPRYIGLTLYAPTGPHQDARCVLVRSLQSKPMIGAPTRTYPPQGYLQRGGWGSEVSCGGHHRPRGKTTTGSALDGAVFDIAQILAYLVHNMSRSQLYLGFGHFG